MWALEDPRVEPGSLRLIETGVSQSLIVVWSASGISL
jgi:hypothetical protein